MGELLWDMLPNGKQLGGAPANFVYHAQKNGAEALLLSALGNDDNGREILDLLKTKNITTDLIQVNEKNTGTVDIELSSEGIPEYIIHEKPHDIVQNSVKAHLHIMLVLASAMVMMVTFRYNKMPPKYNKIALLLCIPGIAITSIGTWLVVLALPEAHMIIYMGSGILLIASVFSPLSSR